MLLNVKNLSVRYGKGLAVENVCIEVQKGKIVIIVGSNGAGKTTILRVISGLKTPSSGEVWFAGKQIVGMEAFEIVRLGLVHVPEGRRLFPYLTVLDNLKLGASVLKDKIGFRKGIEKVFESFPILKERQDQKAWSLSGGEQQMLAIGRALMAKPELLMVDEPSLGLAPLVTDALYSILRAINEDGVSILLVEQSVSLALRLGEYGYVLEVGSVILEGSIDKLRDNGIINRAYLGE